MSTPAVAALDGLDGVNWAGLHHAYGAATDVPAQLRALCSADPAQRSKAVGELCGNVYHQGTRWEASSHVVPFLARLVDHPATPGRASVLFLLRAVAIGDHDDSSLPFDPGRVFAAAEGVTDADMADVVAWLYRDDDRSDDPWPEMADESAVVWARDAYRAAAAEHDRFVAWAGDPDPSVAAGAAELLAWFPATTPVVQQLLEVPDAGEYDVARASANLTLAYVGPGESAVDARLTDLLDAAAPGVRLTAAVALAFRLGDQMPYAGVQVLATARDHAGEITADAFPVPWDRPLLGFAALALNRIGLSF